jgi:tripartite-type tricarboxylate transporter receptor subunit TctC
MVEAGYNVVVESWLGVFVPAKTPADIVGALSAAIGEAVKSSQMIENLAKVGNTTAFQSPQEFAATVKADIARWAPVVKASGFVAED